MKFVVLAAVAAFASFAVVNSAASALLALTFGRAAAALDRYSPASRSALLFRLRLVPAALAAIAGFGISLPIFVAFEPFDTDEPVSRTLVLVAAAGVFVVVFAVWRACSAWRATDRASRAWRRRGRRLDPGRMGVSTTVPVYAIDASFPMVAVLGIVRPVLFVAERVLAECSADELRAILAHECAHVAARDNLKRFALRACPDLLTGGAANRAWTAAAEEAADAVVMSAGPARALDLAEALIHVSRLAPSFAPPLASLFYQGGSVDTRVRRLVDPPADAAVPVLLRGWILGVAAALLAALAVVAAPAVHQAMEVVVRVMP